MLPPQAPMVVQAVAELLAGPTLVSRNADRVGTPEDEMITFRRKARELLGLLYELGVYNPAHTVEASPDGLLVSLPSDAESARHPWVEVTIRWGDVTCTEFLDPVTYTIQDCRRYALEKVTARVFDARRRAGEPAPGSTV